jgi:hypothetical protein
MQGTTGSYALNGTRFVLQPTEGQWDAKGMLGVDGNGHPIYSAVREFQLSWDLASPTDVKQLIDVYNANANTGTVVFDLPKWGDADYSFYSYSGCTMREPEVGTYFNGYISNVKLTIMKVRT